MITAISYYIFKMIDYLQVHGDDEIARFSICASLCYRNSKHHFFPILICIKWWMRARVLLKHTRNELTNLFLCSDIVDLQSFRCEQVATARLTQHQLCAYRDLLYTHWMSWARARSLIESKPSMPSSCSTVEYRCR